MLPQPNGEKTEGSDPSNPIILPHEYRSIDFRNLMKALYPLSVSLRLSLSKSEWISVLKLSTKWYFVKLRTMAIAELERMAELTSVEKIVLGRKVKISSWIISGFAELIFRENTIDDDEAMDVDSGYITTIYKLFRMRELRLEGHSVSKKDIHDKFRQELDDVRAEEQGFKLPDQEIAFEPMGHQALFPEYDPGEPTGFVFRFGVPPDVENGSENEGWGASV